MKHPLKQTFGVISWLIFAVAAGMLAVPRILAVTPPTEFVNPLFYIGVILGLVLVATWGWLQMMKQARPETIDFWFSVGMGAMTARIFILFIPSYFATGWVGISIQIVCMTIFIYAFWRLVKQMQKSWVWVRKLSIISNFWTAFVIAVAASLVAVDLSPWVAVVLLFLAAIYDAWAVWKTKHMQKLAMYFINRRLIPGIAVPYKHRKKYALLGGGDIFFIVLVATSFYKSDPVTMYVVAGTMTAAVVGLFFTSEKNRFYPALPFIFAGLIIGIAVRLMIEWPLL